MTLVKSETHVCTVASKDSIEQLLVKVTAILSDVPLVVEENSAARSPVELVITTTNRFTGTTTTTTSKTLSGCYRHLTGDRDAVVESWLQTVEQTILAITSGT